MSNEEKLALVRAMLGDTEDTDELIYAYLTIAGQKIINVAYPYRDDVTEVPTRYGVLQCNIAVYLLNKRGGEGQTSHTENGITRGYASADVPLAMLSEVTPVIGVIRNGDEDA